MSSKRASEMGGHTGRAWSSIARAVVMAGLLLGVAGPASAQIYESANGEPWDYVVAPLTPHCVQTYRVFMPPEPHVMPEGGWPVMVQLRVSGFSTTDDVPLIPPNNFLGQVLEQGIAVVVARGTISRTHDDPLWLEYCEVAPSFPGHGLFHPPGFVPPDLVGQGPDGTDIVPYDEPAYAMAEKDAVLLIQHVRHLARGAGDLSDEQQQVMALLDHERIAVHGRSAGAIAFMWPALGPDRRGDAFIAGFGGQYDEPTRPDIAVLLGGPVWWPLFSGDLGPGVPHFGLGGHSEIAAPTMGDALLEELVPASALAYEDAALNAILPLYMSYGELSASEDYGKNISATCSPQPFCFDDQGFDGVPPYGIHAAWNGYTWKTLHPQNTRVAITSEIAYQQAGGVDVVPFFGDEAQRDVDIVEWLAEQFDALLVGPEPAIASVVLGNKVAGAVPAAEAAPDADAPVLAFEAAAGTRLSLRCVRKGGELQPTLRLIAPDGGELVSAVDSVSSPKAARIAPFSLPDSGSYRVEVGDASGTGGDFRLTTKAKQPKLAKQVVIVGLDDGSEVASFEGVAGARVKRILVRGIKPPKGFPDIVADQAADLFPTALSIVGPDEASIDLTDLVTTSKSGRRVVVDGFELPSTGTWSIRVGGAEVFGDGESVESVGYARVAVKVLPVKGKTLVELP